MKGKTRRFFSILFTFAITCGLLVITPMTVHAAEDICEIVGGAQYASFKDAVDAAADGQTIRMLADSTETEPVEVDGKTVRLDLNGYILDLEVGDFENYIPDLEDEEAPDSAALTILNGGRLLQISSEGECNLAGEDAGLYVSGMGSEAALIGSFAGIGLGVYAEDGAKATLTGDVLGILAGAGASEDARVTIIGDVIGAMIGVMADEGAEITVNGNVTGGMAGVQVMNGGKATVNDNVRDSGIGVYAIGAGSVCLVKGNITNCGAGAYAESGGEVMIDGTISATNYIYIEGVRKTASGYLSVTTKEGYRTFSDGVSTIWVKIPNSAPTLTGPTIMSLAVGYAATSTGVYTIGGNPAPTVTKQSGNAAITWNDSTKKLDIAEGLANGSYPVVLRADNGVGTARTLTFTLTVGTVPAITGPETITLQYGYATTSMTPFTVTGYPSATVMIWAGSDTRVTFTDSGRRLNIAEGLAPGNYAITLRASNSFGESQFTFQIAVLSAAIADGPSAMKLTEGYASTSTSAFLLGNPAPDDITIESGDPAITWNDSKKALAIASGLMAGSYPVTLKASNAQRDSTFVFTLTVSPATSFVPPSKVISAGTSSFALQNDIALAWGSNSNGRLGIGGTTNQTGPVQIPGFSGVTSISANSNVALKADRTVWTLGSDGPVQIPGMDNVISIDANNDIVSMLRSDGTVWSYGYNWHGQVGDGTTNNSRSSPVQAFGLYDVTAISLEASHVVALKSDGTVWTWGRNLNNVFGDGTTTNRSVPVKVQDAADIVAISAGGQHSAALKSDGTVWCWGYNGYGALGNGTTTSRSMAVKAVGLSDVIAVQAVGYNPSSGGTGPSFTVALKADGTVWAWGNNQYGQLGDGTTTSRSVPTKVAGLSDVTAVAAAGSFNCGYIVALKSDGTLWAWGGNNYGMLGDGTTARRSTPAQISGLTEIESFSMSSFNRPVLKLEKA